MLVSGWTAPTSVSSWARAAAKGSSDVGSPLQHPPTGRSDASRAPGSPAPGSAEGWSQAGQPAVFVLRGSSWELSPFRRHGWLWLPELPPLTAAPSTVLLVSITSRCNGPPTRRSKIKGSDGEGETSQEGRASLHIWEWGGGGSSSLPRPASPRARQGRVSARPPPRSGRGNNNRKRRELAQTEDKQTSQIVKPEIAN